MARDFRKSTIVSVCPLLIHEEKVTVTPMEYVIPPATQPDGIQVLVVGEGKCAVYMDADRGSFLVTIPSIELANAIVNDYLRACIRVSTVAKPGLFVLDGNYTVEEVRKEQADKVKEARNLQTNWFRELVRLADDDWTRFRQHRMISKLQRIACNCLSLQRDWMNEVPEENQICPACRAIIDPRASKCPHCQTVIKPEEYAKFVAGVKV